MSLGAETAHRLSVWRSLPPAFSAQNICSPASLLSASSAHRIWCPRCQHANAELLSGELAKGMMKANENAKATASNISPRVYLVLRIAFDLRASSSRQACSQQHSHTNAVVPSDVEQENEAVKATANRACRQRSLELEVLRPPPAFSKYQACSRRPQRMAVSALSGAERVKETEKVNRASRRAHVAPGAPHPRPSFSASQTCLQERQHSSAAQPFCEERARETAKA